MKPTPLTDLDKLKEQLLFEEQYDKGLKDLAKTRKAMAEYKKIKEVNQFIKPKKTR